MEACLLLAVAMASAGCLTIPPPAGSGSGDASVPGALQFVESWVGGTRGSTVAVTVAGGPAGVYVVVIGANNGGTIAGNVATAITGLGLTWTHVITAPGDIVQLDLWYAEAASATTSGTVSPQLVGSPNATAVAVLLYTGASATQPIGGTAVTQVSGTTPLVLTPATAPPSIVIGGFVGRHGADAFVPSGPLTIRAQLDEIDPTDQDSANLTVAEVASSGATTTIAGTLDHAAAAALELRP